MKIELQILIDSMHSVFESTEIVATNFFFIEITTRINPENMLISLVCEMSRGECKNQNEYFIWNLLLFGLNSIHFFAVVVGFPSSRHRRCANTRWMLYVQFSMLSAVAMCSRLGMCDTKFSLFSIFYFTIKTNKNHIPFHSSSLSSFCMPTIVHFTGNVLDDFLALQIQFDLYISLFSSDSKNQFAMIKKNIWKSIWSDVVVGAQRETENELDSIVIFHQSWVLNSSTRTNVCCNWTRDAMNRFQCWISTFCIQIKNYLFKWHVEKLIYATTNATEKRLQCHWDASTRNAAKIQLHEPNGTSVIVIAMTTRNGNDNDGNRERCAMLWGKTVVRRVSNMMTTTMQSIQAILIADEDMREWRIFCLAEMATPSIHSHHFVEWVIKSERFFSVDFSRFTWRGGRHCNSISAIKSAQIIILFFILHLAKAFRFAFFLCAHMMRHICEKFLSFFMHESLE